MQEVRGNTLDRVDTTLVIGDRREIMRQLGKLRTEKKAKASRINGKLGGAYDETPRTKANRSAAQKARREAERKRREVENTKT